MPPEQSKRPHSGTFPCPSPEMNGICFAGISEARLLCKRERAGFAPVAVRPYIFSKDIRQKQSRIVFNKGTLGVL